MANTLQEYATKFQDLELVSFLLFLLNNQNQEAEIRLVLWTSPTTWNQMLMFMYTTILTNKLLLEWTGKESMVNHKELQPIQCQPLTPSPFQEAKQLVWLDNQTHSTGLSWHPMEQQPTTMIKEQEILKISFT